MSFLASIFDYCSRMFIWAPVTIIIYIPLRVLYIRKKGRHLPLIMEAVILSFTVYCVGLAFQTIMPQIDAYTVAGTTTVYAIKWGSNGINLIPFHTIKAYLPSLSHIFSSGYVVGNINILGNIFIFSPLGIFLPLIYRKLDSYPKIALTGVCVSCFIETMQLFVGRSTDIDDVILNVTGVMVGYILYRIAAVIVKRIKLKKEPQ